MSESSVAETTVTIGPLVQSAPMLTLPTACYAASSMRLDDIADSLVPNFG